jgi:hypothetical protein
LNNQERKNPMKKSWYASLCAGLITASACAGVSANTPNEATKEQVLNSINAQAKQKVTEVHSFSFLPVNLDDDAEQEIVAKSNGAVHLGSFYVLDKQKDAYVLLAERPWNVPRFQLDRWDITRSDASVLNSKDPAELGKVAGHRLFEVIDRTGGSGMDSYQAHLWYLDQGQFHEAWTGTLQEHTSGPDGEIMLKTGSYQIVDNGSASLLYFWETTRHLDGVTLKPKGSTQTTTQIFHFDKDRFVLPTAP